MMEAQTRERLREWLEELEKLGEETKKKEAEAWCLSALSILEQDKDFQSYCGAKEIK